MIQRQTIVGLVLVVALGGIALADEGAAAKRYFVSGSKHFDLGEYTDALSDFKEGYRLKDDPVFLYNIAQCHRLLNQNTEALRAYKTYLRRAPTAPNRDEVERKIAAIEEAQAAANKATTTPPNQVLAPGGHTETPPTTTPEPTTAPASNTVATTAPATPERQPVYKKWWLWTAVGVVAVGVGVGLGVGLSSSSTHYPSGSFSDGTIRF